MALATLLPEVIARTKPGGVYMGVGPEQNFSYLAVMKPRIAFITDVRRGNLHVLLMYKALFELSANRSEFISRLFTKPRTADIGGNLDRHGADGRLLGHRRRQTKPRLRPISTRCSIS